MILVYKCRFCGKEFKRPCALGLHERTCKFNPNRKPLVNHKCNLPKKVGYGNWECSCGLVFNTKNELYKHKHEVHNLEMRQKNQTCPYCGLVMENKRKHYRICEQRRHPETFKWTYEEKKQISNKRKQYLREHPDEHPWKSKDKFVSVPCEKLKNILLEQGYNFNEEYTDPSWEHLYSLDIAFLNEKIDVEVNGNQHYNKDGSLKKYYKLRHEFLESKGWTVIEFQYSNCFKEDKIIELKQILDSLITNR